MHAHLPQSGPRRIPRLDRILSASLLLGILAGLQLVGCSGQSTKAFHLLVISLGHLDADTLQELDPKLHPNLSGWLGTSTNYSDFHAAGDNALANLGSLLTGLKPGEHKAGRLDGDWQPLTEEQTPLAEYLIEHNYNPGAVVAGDRYYDPQLGLGQGFREYEWLPGAPGDIAALGVDWIEHHDKQPFFCFVGLPSVQGEEATELAQLDEALGTLLACMGQRGILDSALIVVTAARPRDLSKTALPLMIKAPLQKTGTTDARALSQIHIPQLILQHAALPVAAVRPNAYLSHALPAPLPPTNPQ